MYFFLKLLSRLFEFIPRNVALFFGRKMGSLFYYFIPIRKSVAIVNINLAFPNLNATQKKKLLHSTYKHFGMVLFDFLRLNQYKRNKNINLVNIPSESIKLFRENNGGILLSAHIGNWEYLGPSIGLHNIKCAGVAQVQHNSSANIFFNELRTSKHMKVIPVDAGSKSMVKAILEGYYLGLISDQNAGKKGTKASFFGKSVSVPKGTGIFHLKTNSPILLGFCILSPDLNYNLSFQQLSFEGLSDNTDEAIKVINQRYTLLLEEEIKKHPHQYFWFHRKWPKKNYRGLSIF